MTKANQPNHIKYKKLQQNKKYLFRNPTQMILMHKN